MADRYESRADVREKIEWEGGIFAALDYGVHTEHMPEGDAELEIAWRELEKAYQAMTPLVSAVERMIEASIIVMDELDDGSPASS